MCLKKNKGIFILVDILYIAMMILPLVGAMVVKILFSPATQGIVVSGARTLFIVPMPIQDFVVTEAVLNSWLIMITIIGLCLYLTHGVKDYPELKRQLFAEMLVEKAKGLVNENMGTHLSHFAPFIAAVLGLSAFSSLMSLLGVFPATADVNTVAGWAILVFILITYYKLKCGPVNYLKSFTEGIPVFAPINVFSEIATPFSMAFRHYGNLLSGVVISVLLSAAFGGLSSKLLSWAPQWLSQIPILQVGIPAILSLYFDVFSGVLQAYIFANLTMLNISQGFNYDLYTERKRKKELKKQQNQTKTA
jgi:F-type H+-transporting ATPase subunit a